MSTKLYVCTSSTPKNNGLVEECATQLLLPSPGCTYHCPTCGALMSLPEELEKKPSRA